MMVPLIRLQCDVNSYGWGKTGQNSAAARYAATSAEPEFNIEDGKPYAELWMGTHSSLPSKDVTTKKSLLELVQENHALMSSEVVKHYGEKLPFLFKVLSISKALSIQAHPNKSLAAQLHAKDPQNYPEDPFIDGFFQTSDDNHKPEMAIAITPFEGLCSFRPLGEIVHYLQTVEPLSALIGTEASKKFQQTVNLNDEGPEVESNNKKALREVFTALMTSDSDSVASRCEELITIARGSPEVLGGEMAERVLRLNCQFPNDVGIFVLFFLNYVTLNPGEGLFLKADDIHAYVSGDIIECMASSDNVVRAGFTPKFKDVNTLTSMLTYSYAPIQEQKMTPMNYAYVTLNRDAYSSDSSALLYDPPIEEFSVVKTQLNAVNAKATFEGINGPSIIICTAGEGVISVGPAKKDVIKEGYVFFVGATAEVVLENTQEKPFTTYRAFCELDLE